jgi:hypothetical protein
MEVHTATNHIAGCECRAIRCSTTRALENEAASDISTSNTDQELAHAHHHYHYHRYMVVIGGAVIGAHTHHRRGIRSNADPNLQYQTSKQYRSASISTTIAQLQQQSGCTSRVMLKPPYLVAVPEMT